MAHVRTGYRPRVLRHRSVDNRRTRSCPREHAFATEWEKENRPTTGAGIGNYGTLQALMVNQRGVTASSFVSWWSMPVRFWVSNKEAAIAATVVQWLGTNCGFDFLARCLKACGYRIERDEKWRTAPDCCPVCHGRGRIARVKGVKVCGWCHWPWRNMNPERTTETA
jgi:hypothetical protein